MQLYQTYLNTSTWYTGPGILLSKQEFSGMVVFELIANTPVEDGLVKCWHGCLVKGSEEVATKADVELAKQSQAGALEAFSADFNIWQNKRPALKIMQLKTDGPFRTGRKWYSQFYAAPEDVGEIQSAVNGTHLTEGLKTADQAGYNIDEGLTF